MKEIQVEDNFEITLPEPLRKALDVKDGDSIIFKQTGNEIYIEKSI